MGTERTPPEPPAERGAVRSAGHSRAIRFVLLIGVLSLFADFTYEGSRSVLGPYLGTLGAGAVVIAVVSGLGELLGYGLRLVSGRFADATHQFWPITIAGYIIQMVSVPLLALAGSWPVAAVLIVLERVGKATRNPPRDAMLSHAATDIGYGTVFGIHEALDQFGAMLGPLAIAGILALRAGGYRFAFATLAIPAGICLILVGVARFVYPRPQDLAAKPADVQTRGLPRIFWIYLGGAALAGAGFADWPLIAFHFAQGSVVGADVIPIFYAVAMAVSGAGSFLFGRLYDRFGIGVLLPLTVVSALYAPLAFLGGFWVALVGASLWGLGMGVQEFDHPGRRGHHGARRPPGLRIRSLHRRLRDRLVSGQRPHRNPVFGCHPRRGGLCPGRRGSSPAAVGGRAQADEGHLIHTALSCW